MSLVKVYNDVKRISSKFLNNFRASIFLITERVGRILPLKFSFTSNRAFIQGQECLTEKFPRPGIYENILEDFYIPALNRKLRLCANCGGCSAESDIRQGCRSDPPHPHQKPLYLSSCLQHQDQHNPTPSNMLYYVHTKPSVICGTYEVSYLTL